MLSCFPISICSSCTANTDSELPDLWNFLIDHRKAEQTATCTCAPLQEQDAAHRLNYWLGKTTLVDYYCRRDDGETRQHASYWHVFDHVCNQILILPSIPLKISFLTFKRHVWCVHDRWGAHWLLDFRSKLLYICWEPNHQYVILLIPPDFYCWRCLA
jgi:hypothetical protein